MHPCSQPRYGLMDCSKWMSGESLVVMMLRASSQMTSVLGNAGSSGTPSASVPHPSSNAWRSLLSNRWAMRVAAPRPLMASTGKVWLDIGETRYCIYKQYAPDDHSVQTRF